MLSMTSQTPTVPVPPVVRPARPWIPVRSLAPRHRPRVLDHLLRLSDHDRYLRFGHPASDEQLARYIGQIDFERDEVFGIINRRLEVIAMAHLAYAGDPRHPHEAEFGVSVATHARGRGFGRRLFDHAVLHARNRGVERMVIHALTENTAMLRIARHAGATVERSGAESEAVLKLPPISLSERLQTLLDWQAAEFDYGLKLQANRLDRWLDLGCAGGRSSTG